MNAGSADLRPRPLALQRSEQEILRRWGERLKGDREVALWVSADPRTSQLRGFCSMLTKIVPQVRVTESVVAEGSLPAIQLGPHVTYGAYRWATSSQRF
jgi:hypothetical protein